MKYVLVILLFALSAYAKTVHLSEYATPNDGLNDSAGFQSAVDHLKTAGGGTIIVDDGVWNLNAMVNFVNSDNLSFKIVSDGGSVIKLGLGGNGYAFYAGNVNHFILENLTFTGDGSVSNFDCEYLLFIAYAQKMIVRDSRFFGIRASQSLLYFGNIDALVENSQFEGNAVTQAQIFGAHDIQSLTVRNTNFRDYANFLGYISKTPNNTGNFISVKSQPSPHTNYVSATVTLEQLRLDEGAPIAVRIQNVPNVAIDRLSVNVSGIDNAAAVLLDNVKYASIDNSTFGYTNNERPALKLVNSSTVEVSRLRFGGGVYFADIQQGSSATISDCAECRSRSGAGIVGQSRENAKPANKSFATRPRP